MRFVDKDFEHDYKEGANFVAEFVGEMLHEKIFEFDIQEFDILPKDLEETARLNMWKRVQHDLIQSFEHIKASSFDYNFTVHTIIDEVKRIINGTNIPRQKKEEEVFTWIVFYSMALFAKDERLKHYRRKPYIQIDRSKDYKEQIFSNIVLGKEYNEQMCNYLGVYETAKLLKMDYLIPIVEISVSVCMWAEMLLSKEKKEEEMKFPEPPENLNTDKAKRLFKKAVEAGLMQPLNNMSGYQWNKSNALLAYFCGKIYCGDSLKQDAITDEWILKRGGTFFPETDLMSFFVKKENQAIKNLGQSRLQMQRPPKGYKDIDRLFDEAT